MDREIKPENNGGHIDFEILKAKPRPIIVKYIRCNARNIIQRNKTVLKGKGIRVTESLIAKRIKGVRESNGTAWICEYMVTKW